MALAVVFPVLLVQFAATSPPPMGPKSLTPQSPFAQALGLEASAIRSVVNRTPLLRGISKLIKHPHANAVDMLCDIIEAGANRNAALLEFTDSGKDASERLEHPKGCSLLQEISSTSMLLKESFQKLGVYCASGGISQFPPDSDAAWEMLENVPHILVLTAVQEESFPRSSRLEAYMDGLSFLAGKHAKDLKEMVAMTGHKAKLLQENGSLIEWAGDLPEDAALDTILASVAAAFAAVSFSEGRPHLDALDKD